MPPPLAVGSVNPAQLLEAGVAGLMATQDRTQDPQAMARQFAVMLVQLGRGLPPEGRKAFRAVIEEVLQQLDSA